MKGTLGSGAHGIFGTARLGLPRGRFNLEGASIPRLTYIYTRACHLTYEQALSNVNATLYIRYTLLINEKSAKAHCFRSLGPFPSIPLPLLGFKEDNT